MQRHTRQLAARLQRGGATQPDCDEHGKSACCGHLGIETPVRPSCGQRRRQRHGMEVGVRAVPATCKVVCLLADGVILKQDHRRY